MFPHLHYHGVDNEITQQYTPIVPLCFAEKYCCYNCLSRYHSDSNLKLEQKRIIYSFIGSQCWWKVAVMSNASHNLYNVLQLHISCLVPFWDHRNRLQSHKQNKWKNMKCNVKNKFSDMLLHNEKNQQVKSTNIQVFASITQICDQIVLING